MPNMQASRFNILTRFKDGTQFLLVNLLSGQADIISREEEELLKTDGTGIPEEFIQKGYWADPEAEAITYRLKYIDFLEQRDREEVQVLFVPTYQCNFDCFYCYQSGYPHAPDGLSPQITAAFFNFIRQHLKGRKTYVTLFGGEPLLAGKKYRAALEQFIERCGKEEIDLAVVTNGYHLDLYLESLKRVRVREIQFTLDGTREIHDRRRPLKGGGPSFDKISANLDACLENGIPVNLRVVVDGDNIGGLPALAAYARERGWSSHPLFKTQLGRNYELHQCQEGPGKLFTRIGLYQAIHDLIKKHPDFLEFHRPAFSVTRFLSENNHLPQPLFDACPACKTEWALDYRGFVYPCTATVGKPEEELGTFHPSISLRDTAIKAWQERDVLHINACAACPLQLACGGGCGSLAKNLNGQLLSPDCKPVKELLELGSAIYF